MNRFAIWNANFTAQTLFSNNGIGTGVNGNDTHENVAVYFPTAGTYSFTYSFDNYGIIYVDGVALGSQVTYNWADTTDNNNNYVAVAKTMTAGWHKIKMYVINSGGQGGVALLIRKNNVAWNNSDFVTNPVIFSTNNDSETPGSILYGNYLTNNYPTPTIPYTTTSMGSLGHPSYPNQYKTIFGKEVVEISQYMSYNQNGPYYRKQQMMYNYYYNQTYWQYTNYSFLSYTFKIRIKSDTDPGKNWLKQMTLAYGGHKLPRPEAATTTILLNGTYAGAGIIGLELYKYYPATQIAEWTVQDSSNIWGDHIDASFWTPYGGYNYKTDWNRTGTSSIDYIYATCWNIMSTGIR
jgi:hypothetical protein